MRSTRGNLQDQYCRSVLFCAIYAVKLPYFALEFGKSYYYTDLIYCKTTAFEELRHVSLTIDCIRRTHLHYITRPNKATLVEEFGVESSLT